MESVHYLSAGFAFARLIPKGELIMKRTIFLFILSFTTYADTIEHFMNIANNIPKMEMKADPQSQAWARSARNILTLTCESISETLLIMNDAAKSQGSPLFCLPAGTQMNADNLNQLIQQTYRELSSQKSDKDKMTVSQVALLGISQHYPCKENSNQNAPVASFKHQTMDKMQHQSGLSLHG